jgi:hypothetical protein
MQSALRGALASCAQLFASVGQHDDAARLCGMLLRARGIPARVEEELAQACGALRSNLGEEAFASAREAGLAMSLDEACSFALEALQQPGL